MQAHPHQVREDRGTGVKPGRCAGRGGGRLLCVPCAKVGYVLITYLRAAHRWFYAKLVVSNPSPLRHQNSLCAGPLSTLNIKI